MGAFDDLIPAPATASAGAFEDLVPPDAGAFEDLVPPESPMAPDTTAPGTVPLADPYGNSTAPTLAAAPPVTPDELTALGRVLGVSPETAPAAGPVNALTPLPAAAPELRDASTGFLNNLSVRDLIKAPQQGAAAGVMKYLTGNTDAEKAKRRKALGQDTDPIEREFNAALEATYQAGGYESPDYQRLDQAFKQYQAARDNPAFSWQDLQAAIAADPGAMAAEFVKSVAADPELLATPLGWGKLAASAGAAAKAVGAGRALTAAAKVAGGVTGSAATGAAITAPVSAGVQLGESGTVDVGRTARETAIGAGASSAVGGLFVGLGAGVRSLRKLKTRPGVDPAAVDAEIADFMQRTEAEAVRAGASPAEARAQVERFAVDIEPGAEGSVVRPRTEILDQLPGEAPATHTMPDGAEMPGATHGAPPPETLDDLQARLVKARLAAEQYVGRNGDIRSELERVVADLEARVARPEPATPPAAMSAVDDEIGALMRRTPDETATALSMESGGIPEQSTFYANPFLIGLGNVARDVGIHTGRNVAAGAAGGVLGATLSENEAGSAKWWVDVGAGAAGVALGAQFMRSAKLLGKGSTVDNWRGRAGTWIDSLPLIGRGPEELRALKGKQRLMQDYLDRQTAEVGKQLLDNFAPSERAMMADLIETRGIVKDLNVIHRQAQALDDYLTYVGKKMKDLGMLPLHTEDGGYLHRYYAKHLGLDKKFKEAKGQSLSGSYTIARGTDDVFGREYLSPGAAKVVDEFEKLKDTQLAELKARRRELAKVEFVEYRGLQDGKLRSFLFTRDEVPRVDTGLKPVLAQLNKSSAPAKGTEAGAARRPGDVTDLKPTNYIWTVRGTKGKEALLHRDWTKYERQSWGEIEDAGYRYTRGMTEAAHDLSLATLFDTVMRKADWVSTTPRATNGKAWELVPTTGVGKHSPLQKYGALAGKYVRPDIWRGLKGYGRNPLRGGPEIPLTGVGLGDAYLAALNKWKLYKTVYNPVTHFNNTYSNVEMLYMGGYGPADLGRGIKHLSQGEQSAVWKEARDAGLFGSDWTTSILGADGRGSQVLAQLAEKLRTQPEIPDAQLVTSLVMDVKEWWIKSGQALEKADGAWKTGAALAEAMGKPLLAGVGFTTKPVKAAGRAMQRAYRFEDNVFKMAVYTAERKKGLTPEQAVNEANKLFFDYQDLPEALKLVRDLPIGAPFISYPYFAIQAIARNVAQNPERVLFLIAGYEAINYATLTAGGMAPGDYWKTESAEEATSPPWDRGRALWGARNTVHLPFMDGYRVALGRAHAMGNPFMTEAGGREKLPQMPAGGGVWGSSVFGGSPLHALLDVSVNEDWKGKEIYKPGAPAEEKARKIAAYLYQAWAPSNLATPGGYQQTKVLEGLANDVRTARAEGKDPGVIGPVVDAANATAEALGFGQFTGLDRADNEIVTRDALLASFGVKLRPIRVEQSVEFETGKLEKEKKKAADWFKSKVRENADGRITDAQLAEHEADFDAARERLDSGQDKLFDAEAFLGKRTTTPRRQP